MEINKNQMEINSNELLKVFESDIFSQNIKNNIDNECFYNSEIQEAVNLVANVIGSQYYAIYHIWVKTHKYICFQEPYPKINEIKSHGDYEKLWKFYVGKYVEAEDQKIMYDFSDLNTVVERLNDVNTVTQEYRRKNLGWAKINLIAAKRDEEGNVINIILAVTDINEEMETKRKKEEAEKEALHDTLTGLLNRKAFDQYKTAKEYRNHQVGVMLIDIDRFKEINDQFGHVAGDKVIKTVSEEIISSLRNADKVFRMGGDEFAVLLYDCNEKIWNSICRKISFIHEDIKELLPQQMNVTLSVGLCICSNGYKDEMYQYADAAMYNTKVNGRAGCTIADCNGNIMEEWHDTNSYLRKGMVLERNSTATWRVEVPKNKDLPVLAYGDDLLKTLLEIENNESPEEMYKVWLKGIEPEYLEIIKEAIKAAVNRKKSEVIYEWKHPKHGSIKVRSSISFDSETSDYYSIMGYNHIITDVSVFTLRDFSEEIRNALEEIYYCNFYIRLNDFTFKAYKVQQYMVDIIGRSGDAIEAVDIYVKNVVADESKEIMHNFLNLHTLKQRMKIINVIECDYLDPFIGWSKARFIAVSRNSDNELEAVSLVVESIKESN